MAERIRTAVIGSSWWADGAHLPGLTSRADVELVGLCARAPERLAALAKKFQIPRTFVDYAQMFTELRPEVVVISTPNHVHAQMTLAALDAGAHVICEKPLALTSADARRMLETAERRGRRHMTFLTYRGMAAPRHVKHLLDSGYLGRLHHAQVAYLHGSWLDARRPASWKTTLAEGGSGVLGDLGSHVIDMLHWWFGPIAATVGTPATFITERPRSDGSPTPVETDDATAFVLEFAAGGHATVQLSRVAPQRHNYQRIELYGSGGTLIYEYEQSLAFVGRVSGARAGAGDPQELPIPLALRDGLQGEDTFPALFRGLTDPFFASLREPGPTPAPSFADGLAVQEVIDAVARSFGSRRWEAV
jgi:predicted dehydrogenase